MTSADLNKINKPNTKLGKETFVITHHQINSHVKEISGEKKMSLANISKHFQVQMIHPKHFH